MTDLRNLPVIEALEGRISPELAPVKADIEAIFKAYAGETATVEQTALLLMEDTSTEFEVSAVFNDAYFFFGLQSQCRNAVSWGCCLALATIGDHQNFFICDEMSKFFEHRGQLGAAIRWINISKVSYYNSIALGDGEGRWLLFSYLLRREADLYLRLGDYAAAIRAQIFCHVFHLSGPDYGALNKLIRLNGGPALKEMDILEGRTNLSEVFKTHLYTSVEFVDAKVLQCELLSSIPSYELALEPPELIGHADIQSFPTKWQIPEQSLTRLSHVNLYQDFTKCGLITKDGSIVSGFSEGPFEFYSLSHKFGIVKPQRRLVGTSALLGSVFGWLEYFHFLTQVVPMVGRVLDSGIHIDHFIAFGASQRSYGVEFLEIAGIDPVKVIDEPEAVCLEVEDLIYPSYTRPLTTEGVRYIRGFYLKSFSPPQNARRVFVTRENTKARNLVIDDRLRSVLQGYSCEIMRLEDFTVAEKARILSQAELIMGPHGAGLAHMVFCPPNAVVIEIFAEGCPAQWLHQMAMICGHRYIGVEASWSGSDLIVSADKIASAFKYVDSML